MDKYKHRVSFRLEKRKDKNGNLPEELPHQRRHNIWRQTYMVLFRVPYRPHKVG